MTKNDKAARKNSSKNARKQNAFSVHKLGQDNQSAKEYLEYLVELHKIQGVLLTHLKNRI